MFYTTGRKNNTHDNYTLLLFFSFILLFFEWFYNHPALRYGGYCLIALLVFFPASLALQRFENPINKVKIKFLLLILVVFIIFISRNLIRITNEIEKYNYKPIINTYYRIDDAHFRIEKEFNKLIKNFKDCNTNKKKCDKQLKPMKKFLHTYIFIKKND